MKKQNKKTGFTLVEMMVAIAVFSVVMVTAMSALINVIDANNKAKSLKTAINNISFALEGISKDMRMGTQYACGSGGNVSLSDCPDGVNTISFRSSKTIGALSNPYIFYKFVAGASSGQLFSCVGGSTFSSVCSGSYSPLTSTEVNLTNVKFYIINVDDTTKQPRMIMTVSGTAGPLNKPKLQTSFDLQTGVSQITRPE